MERWTFRVIAYAGLMTDEYPPFRLETGGDDTGGAQPPEAHPEPPAPVLGGRPGLAST